MSQEEIVRWAVGAGLAVGLGLLGWLLRGFLLGRLSKLIHDSPTDLDDALLAAFRPHVPLWFMCLGIVIGIRHADPGGVIMARVDRFTFAFLMLSLSFAVASFLSRVIAGQASRVPGALPVTTLSQNVVKLAVIGLGALIVLGNLGIEIAPLLTALGVGSLAVALALQPTLSNLFAGFHISISRKIRIGDFVELETGQQGYVVDIGWRATHIRELPNNLVLVPNSRLAEVIVRNYSLPENEQAALVQVGVAYGSDLETVERVTIEAAREIQKSIPGAVTEFEPFIRYHTFGDSSINFTVILRVKEFVDRHLVTHEFVKRLHRRYAETGIQIPFPQRVVHMTREAHDPG